jgi:hypothetical protein
MLGQSTFQKLYLSYEFTALFIYVIYGLLHSIFTSFVNFFIRPVYPQTIKWANSCVKWHEIVIQDNDYYGQ